MVAFFMEKINSKKYKIAELVLLFVIIPTLLAIPIFSWVKFTSVLIALVYVVYVCYKLDFFSIDYN